MIVRFHCGACQQRLGVPEEYVGRRVKCTRCGQAVVVPVAPLDLNAFTRILQDLTPADQPGPSNKLDKQLVLQKPKAPPKPRPVAPPQRVAAPTPITPARPVQQPTAATPAPAPPAQTPTTRPAMDNAVQQSTEVIGDAVSALAKGLAAALRNAGQQVNLPPAGEGEVAM